MLTKLAIWYLRKRKISVLMGFTTSRGSLQSDNDVTYLLDNFLMDTAFYDKFGKKWLLPEGKFSYKEQSE